MVGVVLPVGKDVGVTVGLTVSLGNLFCSTSKMIPGVFLSLIIYYDLVFLRVYVFQNFWILVSLQVL